MTSVSAWSERGLALAEWALAALLGALVLAAALAWLQSSVVLAMSQRVPAQLLESSYWLSQRLDNLISRAGAGGVHPLGLDEPALAAWWPQTQPANGVLGSDQLLLQRLISSDTDAFDCEGRRTVVGTRQVSRLFLRRESVSPLWALACDSGYCDGSGCHALGDAGIVLMTGVNAIRWRLLMPSTATLVGSWQALGPVSTASTYAPVTAVRVQLWTSSEVQFTRMRRWQPPSAWMGPRINPVNDKRAHLTLEMTWGLNYAH